MSSSQEECVSPTSNGSGLIKQSISSGSSKLNSSNVIENGISTTSGVGVVVENGKSPGVQPPSGPPVNGVASPISGIRPPSKVSNQPSMPPESPAPAVTIQPQTNGNGQSAAEAQRSDAQQPQQQQRTRRSSRSIEENRRRSSRGTARGVVPGVSNGRTGNGVLARPAVDLPPGFGKSFI